MDESRARYEAMVSPDGRIQELTDRSEGGLPRPIHPASPETIALLVRGCEIVYRFDNGERLQGLPYLALLEAMRQNVLLTAHKARHEELADEPEVVPVLRQLLAGIEAASAAFRKACEEAGIAA